MHRLGLLRILVAVALCFAGVGNVLATEDAREPSSPGACLRIALDPRPEWVVGATWSPNGQELVIPDILGGSLWRYSSAGKALGAEIRPSSDGLGWIQPSQMSTLSNGYLLCDRHRLVWLDEKLRPFRAVDPDAFPMTPEGRLDAFWSWSAAGDALYSISDIQARDGSWRRAFVSTSLRDPPKFRIHREMPLRDRQEFDFYLMGNRHVAVLDGVGYFLAMTAPPRIFVATDPPRWLRTFPADVNRPAIPLDEGPRNYASRFALYEHTSTPVALFASAHRLFLLTRSPASDGGTRWTVHRIDPSTDRLEQSYVLPSSANHLVVAPGPVVWAVIEKGPVRAKGDQDVHHVLFIPAARLLAPGATGSPVDPCS